MINGEKLRQARDICALTQSELGRRIGANQSSIAYVESGRLSPSAELLNAIATETGFPVAFFQEEVDDDFPLGSLLLFRSRASLTAKQENQVHQYARVLFQCREKLQRHVTSIPLCMPQTEDTPPEEAAQLTRAALGLSPDRPMGDLIRMLELAGVIVIALPLAIRGLDAFSLWTMSGEDSRAVIVVLSGSPGDRRRFSVAHEVGHLVMHRSIRGSIVKIEREADLFAGALLIPGGALRQELFPPVTLTNLAALKRRWRVSMQALIMRAFELGVVSERQKRYLFQQMSARGWRKQEPAALDVPLERPRALRQMAELVYGAPLDFERLARDVHLPQALVKNAMLAHAAGKPDGDKVLQFPATGGPCG